MHDHADSLGAVVKTRRRELCLRQEELAALAEVSTRFVHSLEHDKQTIRLDALLRVLNTLGLLLVVTGPDISAVVQFGSIGSIESIDASKSDESADLKAQQ